MNMLLMSAFTFIYCIHLMKRQGAVAFNDYLQKKQCNFPFRENEVFIKSSNLCNLIAISMPLTA